MNILRRIIIAMGNFKSLRIARLEDLPYWSSPPIQFTYESTADLALGVYTWTDTPSALIPNRPMIDNALYYFRHITLTADITELDFTANLLSTDRIRFQTFLESDSRAPLFREEILMNKFYEAFTYRLTFQSGQGSDTLLAGFRGTLVQGAGLIGKNSVTLKAVISAQEIVDENYIELFRSKYPTPPIDTGVSEDE